jgi:hypothetical protein
VSEEQFAKLLEWIDAKIDVKVEEAFRRDALHESIREYQLRLELRKAFGLN